MGREEAPVWEGFLTFPGMPQPPTSVWSCDGQTAERAGPDQVGVAGRVP